jgi:hypothetical protein
VIYTDEFSGIQKSDTFVLTISCVRSIAAILPLADVTYWITDVAILRTPTYQLTPSGCPNELVFEVKQLGGAALPGSIQFDATHGSETISVYEMDYALTAIYDVTVKVTDPKTGLVNTELAFKAVIKCTKTIDLISGSIAGISYEIDLDQPWALDTPLPQYQQNPVQCAVGTISRTLVYTGSGSAPTFIV